MDLADPTGKGDDYEGTRRKNANKNKTPAAGNKKTGNAAKPAKVDKSKGAEATAKRHSVFTAYPINLWRKINPRGMYNEVLNGIEKSPDPWLKMFQNSVIVWAKTIARTFQSLAETTAYKWKSFVKGAQRLAKGGKMLAALLGGEKSGGKPVDYSQELKKIATVVAGLEDEKKGLKQAIAARSGDRGQGPGAPPGGGRGGGHGPASDGMSDSNSNIYNMYGALPAQQARGAQTGNRANPLPAAQGQATDQERRQGQEQERGQEAGLRTAKDISANRTPLRGGSGHTDVEKREGKPPKTKQEIKVGGIDFQRETAKAQRDAAKGKKPDERKAEAAKDAVKEQARDSIARVKSLSAKEVPEPGKKQAEPQRAAEESASKSAQKFAGFSEKWEQQMRDGIKEWLEKEKADKEAERKQQAEPKKTAEKAAEKPEGRSEEWKAQASKITHEWAAEQRKNGEKETPRNEQKRELPATMRTGGMVIKDVSPHDLGNLTAGAGGGNSALAKGVSQSASR